MTKEISNKLFDLDDDMATEIISSAEALLEEITLTEQLLVKHGAQERAARLGSARLRWLDVNEKLVKMMGVINE